MESAVYLITGIRAAGQSTVTQALAQRFPQSAQVRGDAFRHFIVGGHLLGVAAPVRTDSEPGGTSASKVDQTSERSAPAFSVMVCSCRPAPDASSSASVIVPRRDIGPRAASGVEPNLVD
ncbi:hypothetical protein ACQP1G_23680 [Nocardia sp. CA-107356]|uniref:hypothetical protein n=1 Tax=Nocardia sp. CA-107356 TaxID=3239972 RepID=UPI003D8D2FE7